ncbi:hypothetical protein ACFVH4_22680 [Nocardia ignorata]|uniref:hypothetical protein n=1 Tax=Nocardia ignorata TaxID=145285 RepID=UPI003631F23A
MKQLLDAIDILDDSAAQPSARADLLAFRGKTADSAERLRRHLAYAGLIGSQRRARRRKCGSGSSSGSCGGSGCGCTAVAATAA